YRSGTRWLQAPRRHPPLRPWHSRRARAWSSIRAVSVRVVRADRSPCRTHSVFRERSLVALRNHRGTWTNASAQCRNVVDNDTAGRKLPLAQGMTPAIPSAEIEWLEFNGLRSTNDSAELIGISAVRRLCGGFPHPDPQPPDPQ